MKEEKKLQQEEWYDNPSMVTNLIIGLIFLIILLSQSFAINHNLSVDSILISIMNHNMIYLLVIIYFILLKTQTGKKYFNFLNIFLIVLYAVTAVTSFLTIFQSFTLRALLSFGVNVIFVVYLVYTFLQNTRVWKEFKLEKSLFSDIQNSNYFYSIIVLSVLLLTVNLISTTSLDGTILTTMDFIYTILFARYIYLYHDYLDQKYKRVGVDIGEKVREIVKEQKLDEKIQSTKEKIVDATQDMKDKVDDFVENSKIDERINEVQEEIVDAAKNMKDKVDDLIQDTKTVSTKKSTAKKNRTTVKKKYEKVD